MNLKELLNNIEFDYKIIKDEEGKNAIQLIDEMYVNLGHIEDDIFYNVADIIDRTEQYWKDYVIDDAAERLGLGENSTWEDVYKASVLKDDIATDILRSLVHPETVEIEEFNKIQEKNTEQNPQKQATNFVLEKLKSAGIEVVTDKEEFNRILEREKYLQMMHGTLTAEEQRRYFTFNDEESKHFKEQVDEWKKNKDENRRFNSGKLIEVGKIPPLFKALGISDNLIEVQYSTLSKMTRSIPEGYPNEAQGHALTIDDIYSIPKQLADPVMVFKSRTRADSYVFFTERKDSQNRTILIPLAVNKNKGRIVINEITSMYGRNNEIDFVKSNLSEGNLIYADKKRSLEWERECKVQFLTQGLPNQDSINNILTKERLVNFISADSQERKPVQKMAETKRWCFDFSLENPNLLNYSMKAFDIPGSPKVSFGECAGLSVRAIPEDNYYSITYGRTGGTYGNNINTDVKGGIEKTTYNKSEALNLFKEIIHKSKGWVDAGYWGGKQLIYYPELKPFLDIIKESKNYSHACNLGKFLDKTERTKSESVEQKNFEANEVKKDLHINTDNKKAEEKPIVPPFEIFDNKETGRVNIKLRADHQNPHFGDIVKELKLNNWKYAPSKRQWYPMKVDGSKAFAEKLLEKYSRPLNTVEKNNPQIQLMAVSSTESETIESLFTSKNEENLNSEIDKLTEKDVSLKDDFITISEKTPFIFKEFGLGDFPVNMYKQKLARAFFLEEQKFGERITHGHKGEFTSTTVKEVLKNLGNPRYIFNSKQNLNNPENFYLIGVYDELDEQKNPMVLSLHFNKNRKEVEANWITSIYGKRKNILVNDWTQKGYLVYMNDLEMEKAPTEVVTLQMRVSKSASAYIDNVKKKSDFVNDFDVAFNKNQENVYGFAYEGKIYLNPNFLNSNVAVHEYTHLWDEYTRRTNPELWQKGMNIFKDTKFFAEVKNDPNYADIAGDDNLVLSEVHARICGDMAQKILERIAKEDGEITRDKAIDWNDEVFEYVYDEFGFGRNSAFAKENGKSNGYVWSDYAQFLVTPIKDLISGKNISLKITNSIIQKSIRGENSMNHDETLIFEDLQALSNEEYSALPKFNRVKIYNPRDYDILPDGDKIHVLAEYSGEEDEDAVFNQLNDKDFPSEFNGVEINWNPISTKQSGTIEQYLEHLVKVQEAFEKEKESYNISDIIKETVEKTVNEKLEQHNEKFYRLLKQHFPEVTKEVSDIIFTSMPEIESEVVINKSGVFVKDITDGKQEVNKVDFATLADYALGNPLLTEEQTKTLENIVKNSNNKEVNMETKQLDEIDKERMDELAKKAYQKYQYEWLSEHGISLDDIADEMDAALDEYMEETNGERIGAWNQLLRVIHNGINGEMFASLDEFKTNEFLDPKSVELGHFLEGHDKDEYLSHIQSYAKSLGVEIENPIKEAVTVRHELANTFIDRQSDSAKENIKSSLESLKAIPLDIYTLMDDKGNSKEAYLVSQTINGSFSTHLINENGLHWGHYDIPSELQAQSQAAKRAANRSFENINIVENYNTFGFHRKQHQEPLAQAIWDREDIKFAIANNPDSKIDESQVTDKQIDDVIGNLNTERLEEAMVETGWTYIDQAVSETIEMNREQEHRLDNVYVADKDRKVALKFKPDIQFNEQTGEFDTPHISVTMENTITGTRFTDSNFKENVSKDVFLKTPFIDKFIEKTAAEYGITKDKIEYITREDFEAIAQDRESITPVKEQKPLERWTRMTQDMMFKKGIEDNKENTDKILSIAKGILKSFSAKEKEQCQFNLSLDTKYKNEKEALAHALGSGYTHDLSENIKRNQIRVKNRDSESISR